MNFLNALLRVASACTAIVVLATASALAAVTPLDAIRLHLVSRGFGNTPVSVASMQQSGDSIVAVVTIGETGTTLFLHRNPDGSWAVVGGSAGAPPTVRQMVSLGFPVRESRVLVAHRGAVLLSPRHPMLLHPVHDLVRRGIIRQ